MRALQSDAAPDKEILVRDGRRQRLLHYRRYMPQHFIGMPVWRDFAPNETQIWRS